jgi:hypothetical protein
MDVTVVGSVDCGDSSVSAIDAVMGVGVGAGGSRWRI